MQSLIGWRKNEKPLIREDQGFCMGRGIAPPVKLDNQKIEGLAAA
jgi:hypothetical protein